MYCFSPIVGLEGVSFDGFDQMGTGFFTEIVVFSKNIEKIVIFMIFSIFWNILFTACCESFKRKRGIYLIKWGRFSLFQCI